MSGIQLLLDKKRECLVQTRAFEIWLDVLAPIRWLTIFITVFFPALAGLTVVENIAVMGMPWQDTAATLTFFASIVAALHSAFKCDAHQAACKTLAPLYSSLADDFAAAVLLEDKVLAKRTQDLLKKLSDLKKATTETPIRWAIEKAEAQIA